jgi:hypothetical protein
MEKFIVGVKIDSEFLAMGKMNGIFDINQN